MISLVANVPMVQLAQEFDNIFDSKDETPFYFAKWYRYFWMRICFWEIN